MTINSRMGQKKAVGKQTLKCDFAAGLSMTPTSLEIGGTCSSSVFVKLSLVVTWNCITVKGDALLQ